MLPLRQMFVGGTHSMTKHTEIQLPRSLTEYDMGTDYAKQAFFFHIFNHLQIFDGF